MKSTEECIKELAEQHNIHVFGLEALPLCDLSHRFIVRYRRPGYSQDPKMKDGDGGHYLPSLTTIVEVSYPEYCRLAGFPIIVAEPVIHPCWTAMAMNAMLRKLNEPEQPAQSYAFEGNITDSYPQEEDDDAS